MSGSKLIELSYYDPSVQVRLSAYADTVVLDHNEKGGVICAIHFGGYPEMVRAMADAIYAIVKYPAMYKSLHEEGKREVNNIRWYDAGLKVRRIYDAVINHTL